jgi:hypothetical protein
MLGVSRTFNAEHSRRCSLSRGSERHAAQLVCQRARREVGATAAHNLEAAKKTE